ANNTGFMWENAKQFRAMNLFLEHRYYGESVPFGKVDKNLTKIGYLSMDQALADFADFIQYIKATIPGAVNSPVVVFGGSYGGMLASAFRLKYPGLSVGAIAASAPILAVQGLTKSCSGFPLVETKDFTEYSANCSQTIKNSWTAIERIVGTVDGRKWLTNEFKLCKELAAGEGYRVSQWLDTAWANTAMVDYSNAATFLSDLPAYPMREMCKQMTNPGADDRGLLSQVHKAANIYYNYTGHSKCCDLVASTGLVDMTVWGFQSCTDIVLPFCANGKTMFEPFDFDFKAFSDQCFGEYGVRPDPRKAMMLWENRSLRSATNLIFSNGLRDPWSSGGVLDSLSDSVIALTISHGCHHEDLRPAGVNDTQKLINVRNQEKQYMKQWIEEHYIKLNYFPNEWLN
ncbi:unnamed protein product, partial [Medioppia subpectinata]